MKLTRPLCFLDIESATAGKFPDPAVDTMLTLAIIKLFPESGYDASQSKFTGKWNPHFQMSESNIAIHGITNEEAATFPDFTSVEANNILAFISGCDLGGFGIHHYDVPLLWENMYRVGIEWQLSGVSIIDSGAIFKKREERTLTAAKKFYCGEAHEGAHDAMADTQASIDVFFGQLNRYPDLGAMEVQDIAKYSRMNDAVDLHGIIVRDEAGIPCFGTKRNKGVRVVDDLGYAAWIMRSDFPANTRRTLARIMEQAQNPDQDTLF